MKAYYDQLPNAFEEVGNGSVRYRFNITQITSQNTESEDTPTTQYLCDEVIVWKPLSSNKITQAVIGELWQSDYEQKLINEFNAANLGLIDGSKTSAAAKVKIANYKAFLSDRDAIKAQVDKDCAENNIN